KFAEKYSIPFGETQAGKSSVLSDNPLNLGGIGTTGNSAANQIAIDADLVIGVGTRYTDFTTASKWLFQNPKVDFININVSDFDAYKLDAVKIVCDAKAGLDALTKKLGSYQTSYKNEITKAKSEWAKELARLYSLKYKKGFKPEVAGHLDHVLEEFGKATGSYLTQTRVIGLFNELLEKKDVIVGSSGSLPGDLQRVWQSKGLNTYHMEYGYSCMGYEIAASLGTKLAIGDKGEVYSMVGDGSYLMLHTEILTAIQEDKKINVVLLDNMAFGCINNLQMGNGMGSFGTEFRKRNPKNGKMDGELIKIDFAKSAEGYGCKTYSIKTEGELIAAIKDSKKQKKCVLFDIKVLPKTMTDGYNSWWRTCHTEVAINKKIEKISTENKKELAKARKY
ncbi:MAG: thiamine pyrophosphate-dependent enzyme, partial [Fusobacteriaceae bacterium]